MKSSANKKNELPAGLEFDSGRLDFETQKYAKGEFIFVEGTVPQGLYYIKSGKVLIYRDVKNGDRVELKTTKPGDFIGYSDILNQSKHTRNALAMENTELFFIQKKDFLDLLNSRDITMYFFRLTSIDVMDLEEKLYNGNNVKLVEAKKIDTTQATLNISMEELVSFLGAAAEGFIKVLSGLNNQNIISVKSNMMTMPEDNRAAIIKHLQSKLLNAQN